MTDRPTPDPSWDYAPIWQELTQLESKLDEIFDFLQKQEESSIGSNSQLIVSLGILDGKLERIFDLVELR
ncbi:hypothetical protein [Anabaena azotica]|uniref:hypothetical protein n=1 Tax=Anabaena azotica TaxID=197653 RepID=UPI0039A6016B